MLTLDGWFETMFPCCKGITTKGSAVWFKEFPDWFASTRLDTEIYWTHLQFQTLGAEVSSEPFWRALGSFLFSKKEMKQSFHWLETNRLTGAISASLEETTSFDHE